MRRAEHVARMGRRKINKDFFGGGLNERDHLEYTEAGRIILKWILKNWYCNVWNRLILRKTCFGIL
jgi:hypothetical protein